MAQPRIMVTRGVLPIPRVRHVRIHPTQRRNMRQHERDSRPPVSVADPQIAVVIPALNEEKSIGRVLQAIPKQFAKLVVVVDNGSSDHTVTLALADGAQVLSEPHKGYGAACLAGIAALPEEVEIIVF